MPQRPPSGPNRQIAAFTLIEILTVLGLLGIIVAILIPTVARVQGDANQTKSLSNLRQIFIATELYRVDNNDRLIPSEFSDARPESRGSGKWIDLLLPYLGGSGTFTRDQLGCPGIDPDHRNFWSWGYGMNAQPGLMADAAVSSSAYNRDYINADGSRPNWTSPFLMNEIRDRTRRAFFITAAEWQVPAVRMFDFTEFNRFGNDRALAVFFDGNTRVVRREELTRSFFPSGEG
jgi:type II secretory pathway pseudopilin PulG